MICKLYTLKKKAGIQLTLNTRNINGIDDKFKTDWIWLLWKILLNEAIKKENKQLISNVKYLYSLYKIDYKTSCISKRHFIIYQVLYIIIKPVNFNRCYISKEYLSVQATMNINKLYQAIDYNVGKEYSNKDSFIEKENYVQKIKQDMYNEENRKRDAMVKKKEKKIKQEEHEEYETTNKLSYLNDLLFIKQSAKPVKTEEKDVVKYFKDDIKDKIKDKIIYKNIVY